MPSPYMGATTAHFYVVETVPGVTPTNPAWKPLRTTGGMPGTDKDFISSAELGQGREVTSLRAASESVSGEFAVELSRDSQDDAIAAAMTSSWVAGSSAASLQISVNGALREFTRASGDFTTAVKVGDYVCFVGLPGDNGKPFLVSAVTATKVTAVPSSLVFTTDTAKAATLKTADKLETGNLCVSVSVMTWLRGKCGTPDAYIITSGVEFTGFNFDWSTKSLVTGSLPFSGKKQTIMTSQPAGSTFPAQSRQDPYSSIDVTVYDGQIKLEMIESLTITNENAASDQFALGSSSRDSVLRGLTSNKYSLSGFLYDTSLLAKFMAETETNISCAMSNAAGGMAFTVNKSKFTASKTEIAGAEAVKINIEGQGTGNAVQSSITIQRLVLP